MQKINDLFQRMKVHLFLQAYGPKKVKKTLKKQNKQRYWLIKAFEESWKNNGYAKEIVVRLAVGLIVVTVLHFGWEIIDTYQFGAPQPSIADSIVFIFFGYMLITYWSNKIMNNLIILRKKDDISPYVPERLPSEFKDVTDISITAIKKKENPDEEE